MERQQHGYVRIIIAVKTKFFWKKDDPNYTIAGKNDGIDVKNLEYTIHIDKNVNCGELRSLLSSVGFGKDVDEASLSKSISTATLTAYAINSAGKLIGYLSVLSDGVFSAFVDMVIVCPSAQRLGIGKSLINTAEQHFKGIPMYVMPFEDQKDFFEKQGYKIAKRPMQALSKRNN